ncbi:hypothetical protein G7Y79_00019g047700 [Physcia stellaris]|nr:hypothetical protein G7Y79_00019g047700 [Physcia stellaris]
MSRATNKPIYFGTFLVTPQVFHLTPLSFALFKVNLKPLLPGHVLVSPRRVTTRFSDLTQAEITDLFLTVQKVGRMVERVFSAKSLNIAIQDGAAAGQSVPHVHTHIIPRKQSDLDHMGGSDAIYGMLDGEEGDIGNHLQERASRKNKFPTMDNQERKPRTEEEMSAEAEKLFREMDYMEI